jgi:hypothetical protein
MTILPKAINRVNAVSVKIPMSFFNRNRKMNTKIYLKTKKTYNSQSNPKQKTMLEVSHHLTSIYYTVIVTKASGTGIKTGK